MALLLRVLVVDDEPEMLQVCKGLLEAQGDMNVDTVASGCEALARMDGSRYDVIVSDYKMPGMDGVQLLKALKARGDGTPFIIFTGRGREEVAMEALNNGASFYLQKGGASTAQFVELSNMIRRCALARQAEGIYRQFADLAQEGIWMIDASHTTVFANQRMADMLGFSLNELLGTDFLGFLAEKVYEVSHSKPRHIGSGYRDSFELEIKRKDGERLATIWEACMLTDCEGNFNGAIAFVYDITERRRLEDDLKRSNQKLRLLSSITRHDIANTLMVMNGHVDMARDYAMDPQMRAYLERVMESSRRLEKQLDFSRDCSSLGEPRWMSLRKACQEGLRTVDLSGIEAEAELGDVEIFVDQLFERVIHNLADNAVRHGQRTAHIRIRSDESEEGLRITFADDGIGIRPEEKGRLFAQDQGHGLCLIREILHTTGITMREVGEYGEGARFELIVPKRAYRTAAEI